MAITNLATIYADRALDTIIGNTYSAPFIIPDNERVQWMGAKTFIFFGVTTPGLRDRTRNAVPGLNGSLVEEIDNFEQTFTLTHDRFAQIHLDKADFLETGEVVSPEIILDKFTRTQWAPNIDAFFFSKVATDAIAVGNTTSTALASYTKANVYGLIKGFIADGTGESKLRRYANMGSLFMFVNSTIMNLLEQSDDFQRKIEMTTVGLGGIGLNSRVTSIDGIRVVEVIEDERLFTSFDFNPATVSLSFEAAIGSFGINVLFAAVGKTRTVPKINDVYTYVPGQAPGINGYLIEVYAYWDTFVFPNDLNGAVFDSIYADIDTIAVT